MNMNGILVIDKPAKVTSHHVVRVIRDRFHVKKVGHAGTLDPMATGVLVLLLGKATKSAEKFLDNDKEYLATLFLGKSTDTQDSTGKVLEEKEVSGLTKQDLGRAFDSFLGEIEQIPPMVSAKKKKGVRLYKMARKGKVVERKPCRINIREIELIGLKLPEAVFRVRCSKGTYIRTLCEDIGKVLGYPAHMSGLVRTASGKFSLDDAHNLKNVNREHIISI